MVVFQFCVLERNPELLRNLHFRNFIPNEKQIAFNRSLEITLCDLIGFNIVLVHKTILYEG